MARVPPVTVNDGGLSDDRVRLGWSEVRRVTVVTRSRWGVPLGALRWAFTVEASEGRLLAVPSEHTEALLERAHLLPGFDHGALREALGGHGGQVVAVFDRRPSSTLRHRRS